jgi:uncharacterized protein YjiS (DUF1127 family)
MFNLKNIRFIYVSCRGTSFFLMERLAASVFRRLPMALTARSGALGSTFTLALAGVAVRAVRLFAAALKNRSQVRSLHELDDRALKDIGLVRSDIVSALDQPLYLDPSQHLADVAGGGRNYQKPAIAHAVVSTAGLHRVRRPDADVRQTPANAACA